MPSFIYSNPFWTSVISASMDGEAASFGPDASLSMNETFFFDWESASSRSLEPPSNTYWATSVSSGLRWLGCSGPSFLFDDMSTSPSSWYSYSAWFWTCGSDEFITLKILLRISKNTK